MKFKIESDGTPQGTVLSIDGRAVTDEEDVEDMSFSARVGWEYGEGSEKEIDPGRVRFDYSSREYSDEDGGMERMYYSWSSGQDAIGKQAASLGRSAEAQDNHVPDEKLEHVHDKLGCGKYILDASAVPRNASPAFRQGLMDLAKQYGAVVRDHAS